MTSSDIPSIVTIIGLILSGGGLILTGVGLIFSGKQLQLSQKIATGDFLLRLDEAFRRHYDVYKRLRPSGAWAEPGSGPADHPNDDWAAVESYMGLFERIRVLVDRGIVDLGTIDRFYGYRISNIVTNDRIRIEKIEKRAKGWRDFIALARALTRYP